jgi:hypothetical protein
MVTAQDVRDYLGIDYEDEATERRIEQMISATDGFMAGSLGAADPRDDPRVRELALLVIRDLYDTPDWETKETRQFRRIIESMSLQIRLEMREGNGIQETNNNRKTGR